MKEEDKILKKAIKEIIVKQKKYRDPDYSAAMLAEELGMSIFQLSRALKRVYKCSYADIVLPLRINDAKKRILKQKKNHLNMDEIGLSVGFMNKWSFFQAFRKYTNTSPKDWQKNNETQH